MLFAAGILVQIINFDAIAVFGGAAKEIAEADVTTGEAVFALLFGLAIMLIVYYGPALVYVLVPGRSAVLLGRMTDWIVGNSRAIEVVVGLGFGAYFLWKGLSALL
jgi:Sap, sulfolipid-1-addressing protein